MGVLLDSAYVAQVNFVCTHESCPCVVFDDVLALDLRKHAQVRNKLCGMLMQSYSCMIVCHFCILPFAR